MYSVTYILMYTAVVVIEHIHTKKYQVVGIKRTMIRVHIEGAFFAIRASPPTTLGWPGLQWVYVHTERSCIMKYYVARIVCVKFGIVYPVPGPALLVDTMIDEH